MKKAEELQVTLLFGGKVWRSAGCRLPNAGEHYVAKTGKIVFHGPNDAKPSGDRLIVRELPPVKERAHA